MNIDKQLLEKEFEESFYAIGHIKSGQLAHEAVEVLSQHLQERPTNYLGTSINDWAEAIANRVADKSPYDSDDTKTLKEALSKALKKAPEVIGSLVGTAIIEESYFGNES